MSLLPDNHLSGLFISAPVRVVSDCLIRWGNEEQVNRGISAHIAQSTLQQAWDYVANRKVPPDRAFLISIGSWTALFDNHPREFLAQAELYVLCERLKTDTCFFSYDDRDPEHKGSAHFCYYRFHGGGELPVKEREVLLLKESGWRFQQYGDPLPFEQVAFYTLPKKRDRLTPELMRAYGQSIGIPFWDPGAYGHEVVLLEWSKGPQPDATSALKKIMQIFGKPTLIVDRDGARKPPS